MNNDFFRPNVREAIESIFDYSRMLEESNVDEKLIDKILNKDYYLYSVNWIYNLGIDKIYNDEFSATRFKNDVWSWYAGMVMIITRWLEIKGNWVIPNRKYQIMDTTYFLRQFNKTLVEESPMETTIFDIGLNELVNFFPNTFSALNNALLKEVNELDRLSNLENGNKDIDNDKMPISFILDPFYLVLTFVI